MKQNYSIWLIPAADEYKILQAIIHDYVALFGGKIFSPHMTLFSDLNMDSKNIIPFCHIITEKQPAFSCPVIGIDQEKNFFRSFYCAFERSDLLNEMRKEAELFFPTNENKVFNPHISLAYGVDDSVQKQQEIQKQAIFFIGKTIKFDRVAIVSSSDATPIQDWKIVHSFNFL